MKYIYLDNFRGFSKTSVPLLDVNFLVGENSTGKTSLLGMWRLLSSPNLFSGEQMGGDEWPLGHFSEMVSAHSRDQSYFRLGWAGEQKNSKGETRGLGILVTFQKIEGVSAITRLTCTMPKGEVHIRIEGRKVFHKFETLPATKNAEEMHQRLLGWAEGHRARRKGEWKEISAAPSLAQLRQTPFFMFLAIASRDQNAKSDSDGSFEFVLPPIAPSPAWIAPIRSKPRRTYDEPPIAYSPEGTHTPYAIRRILNSDSERKKFNKFIQHTGKASGLFQRIDVKTFGESDTSPFELDAYLDDRAFGISSLGYGVSQSLPILVELLDRPRHSWFAIQQPEVHLHPRAQAALGDAFFEMASQEHKRFVIETHSDFTIDRFRINYQKKGSKSKAPTAQILFFERRDQGNKVTSIPIDENGDLSEDQPESYRQFFIHEQMQMLGLK